MAKFPIASAPENSPINSHPIDSQPSVLCDVQLPSPQFVRGTFKGEPAITIPHEIEASLAAKFQNTLVGKFSQGKPGMDLIRKFVIVQNFKGTVLVGSIDKKHVLLRFDVSADYIRMFSRSIWNVGDKPMRILKWTPDFRIDRESSIIPIWLSLPMLPIHLVNEDFIFSLVSSFSKPLRIDNATEQLKRPSVARVQVEFDLLELLPPRVWIQSENGTGFWQAVEIEEALPPYCNYCWHIGHQEQFCTVKHPNLHAYTQKQAPCTHKEYRPKQQSHDVGRSAPAPSFVEVAKVAEMTDKMKPILVLVSGSTKEGFDNFEQTECATSQVVHKDPKAKFSDSVAKKSTPIKQVSKQDMKVTEEENRVAAQQEHFDSGESLQISTHEPNNADNYGLKENKIVKVFPQPQPRDFSLQELSKSKDANDMTPTASDSSWKLCEKGMQKENKETHTSQGLVTRNSFEVLSNPRMNPMDIESIQAELQNMDLECSKVRSMGYISDTDRKAKLTPFQKIRRSRKPKKVFDL